jgi:D-psicose/D-tagatose/L-ribulose 3-epimerase
MRSGKNRFGVYTGPVVLESCNSAVVHPTLSNTLTLWRNLWDDGAELARHARDFLRDRLD